MVYDNTKFYAAFDAWLDQNVEQGFGEHYAGELLDDFCQFCKETKMMKRSPGRVLFGKRLAEKGFEKRKVLGLTHWSGLMLVNERVAVRPKRYKKTVDAAAAESKEREEMALREEFKKSPEGRMKFLERFRKEMEAEEKRLKGSEGV